MPQSDGSINVKFDDVASIEAQMATTLKKLQNRLADLESALNPIHRSWSGDAQAAYKIDKTKWDTAAREMNTVLAQLKSSVGDAHTTYTDVNRKTTSLFT